jgi:hypothetical protein
VSPIISASKRQCNGIVRLLHVCTAESPNPAQNFCW